MQTFAEFIAESLHSEVALRWELKSTTHAVASFALSGAWVEVSFEQREAAGPWHVGFTVMGAGATEAAAFGIFNGVFQAVREFLETRQPKRVVFISKSEDLASIYQTYLRREKTVLEQLGYELEDPHRVDPYTGFTLRRIQPADWRL